MKTYLKRTNMHNQASRFSEVKSAIIDNNPPPDAEVWARTERRYSPPAPSPAPFTIRTLEDREAAKLLALAERMAWYIRRRTATSKLNGEQAAAEEFLTFAQWSCNLENTPHGRN